MMSLSQAGTEVEVGRCQVDVRDEAHATFVSFVYISFCLAMMMFQWKRAKTS